MCSSFSVENDTYSAVRLWLEILNKYDDAFIKENIAEFKTRYIQQKDAPKTGPTVNRETILAYLEIDNNNFNKAFISEDQSQSTEIPKFDKSDVDLHALGLQVFIEPINTKTNLEEELENLSEILNDFVDIDDNLIDYFK